MPFTYRSGEIVMQGDRVTYAGHPGEVEFVVDPRGSAEDCQVEQYDWYMETFGGGVMILEPKVFGRLFLDTTSDEEDLKFVSRRPDGDSKV
jgi:hypothetical protein